MTFFANLRQCQSGLMVCRRRTVGLPYKIKQPEGRLSPTSRVHIGGAGPPSAREQPDKASTSRLLERHSRVVRTGLSARVAHSIREGAMPSAIYCIGVATIVLCIHEQRIVAVNVHSGPTRPGPIKIHDSPSAGFGASRGQRNGGRCRSWR
jgi:hypothetical protein